jgi:hypothetical protein
MLINIKIIRNIRPSNSLSQVPILVINYQQFTKKKRSLDERVIAIAAIKQYLIQINVMYYKLMVVTNGV